MPFATLAIAALLSTAAHPTNSREQPNAVESQSNVREPQSAPNEQRPTCCDQMRNCTGMHARSATHAADSASDAISTNGA